MDLVFHHSGKHRRILQPENFTLYDGHSGKALQTEEIVGNIQFERSFRGKAHIIQRGTRSRKDKQSSIVIIIPTTVSDRTVRTIAIETYAVGTIFRRITTMKPAPPNYFTPRAIRI